MTARCKSWRGEQVHSVDTFSKVGRNVSHSVVAPIIVSKAVNKNARS